MQPNAPENTPRYVALIGDMVRSRDVEDFASLSARFHAAMDDLSERFEGVLASRFLVTLGDEFQGLLTSFEPLVDLFIALEEALYPCALRYGIASGPLTSGAPEPVALGMYGPCWTRAREAMDRAKDLELPAALGDDHPEDELLEACVALRRAIVNGWSEKEFETVRRLRIHGVQQRVADELGVHASTVLRALNRADWGAVSLAEGALRTQVRRMDARLA